MKTTRIIPSLFLTLFAFTAGAADAPRTAPGKTPITAADADCITNGFDTCFASEEKKPDSTRNGVDASAYCANKATNACPKPATH